jgi:RNA exonuclease 1
LASQKEFVRTVEKPQPSADGDYGVYALDCEMCYSTGGGEPARIAVISSDGKTV